MIGACGRVIAEEFAGPTLSELIDEPWLRRAELARQLIQMAKKFSNSKITQLLFVKKDNSRIFYSIQC